MQQTTVANDVIYGYCVRATRSALEGSGFAARSEDFDGNLSEDTMAGSAGGLAATGLATAGWTMQMVALKPLFGQHGYRSPLQSFTPQP